MIRSFVLLLTLAMSLTAHAQHLIAQGKFPFPNVKVTGLERYNGFYVTEIVGQGALSLLQSRNSDVTFKIIKKFQTKRITAGEALFGSTTLSKDGFATAYSLVLLVVHRNPTFCWRTLPEQTVRIEDPSLTASPICAGNNETRTDQLRALIIDSIKKPEMDQMIFEQSDIVDQDRVLTLTVGYKFGTLSQGTFIIP